MGAKRWRLASLAVVIAVGAAACASTSDGSIRGRAVASDGLSTASEGAEYPAARVDHLHQAVGISVCGEWAPPIADPGIDPEGIHTHGEGIIHVHPFVESAAGASATLEVFADLVDVRLSDGELLVGSTPIIPAITTCDGRAGSWSISTWSADEIEAGASPSRFDHESDVVLNFDRGAVVWAFGPEGEDPAVPPSLSVFDEWDLDLAD
jgi:hypothetical protein